MISPFKSLKPSRKMLLFFAYGDLVNNGPPFPDLGIKGGILKKVKLWRKKSSFLAIFRLKKHLKTPFSGACGALNH